ncbi:DUF1559 domain-containing protein [Thalassoglobus sp. JC818]|uniref:DUF1559 family PulG-like putative transporter n=1 Tax=Thalassoglobus sp. JC818 TaxID=3232136 RepID=UPI0034595661
MIGSPEYASHRSGLTLIEVLVVLSVLSVLVALILPAALRVREMSRLNQCSNNLRNLSIAMMQFEQDHHRLPGAGYFLDPSSNRGGDTSQPVQLHHNWAVLLLPYVDQSTLFQQWNLDEPIDSAQNGPLLDQTIAVLRCPSDSTLSGQGDLSYALNGGWGFTTRTTDGVGDCPVATSHRSENGDWELVKLDLNGDGHACSGNASLDDRDRKHFKQLGLFFVENWWVGKNLRKPDYTERFYGLADIHDGTSQTFLITDNLCNGFRDDDPLGRFANPHPLRTMFFVGNACLDGKCIREGVDYSRSNSGASKINSGRSQPEQDHAIPNSDHPGGVNMTYADGHVRFLTEQIDGRVYAALASPQGSFLNGTPLAQGIISSDDF